MYDYFAGCDTHKETHFISIINVKGEVKESFEITNAPKGWINALKIAKRYPKLIWGIENSPNFAKRFCEFLCKEEQVLKEVNPVFTGKYRKAGTNRNKTDCIDSIAIARILRDEYKYLPDIKYNKMQEELKILTKQRDILVKEQTSYKNKLHAKLNDLNPEYKIKYGNINNRIKPLRKIKEDLKSSRDILSIVILQDIKILETLTEEILRLEEIMKEKEINNSLIRNLTTLTGINTVNSCKLVGLIGDINRFKSPNHLASFAGIPPVEKSSGKGSRKFRNVGGNRQLNRTFYLIALTQIIRAGIAKDYYLRKITEGKTKKQALHCLMRRLVNIIWMMYKHNQPYSYNKVKSGNLTFAKVA